MILLLGRTGYIGSEFISQIAKRDLGGFSPTRRELDYTRESCLRGIIEMCKPSVLINAAAYIPTPSVDLCKNNKPETWRANVNLPAMLARVCRELGITFCHISTGCLFDEDREYKEDDLPVRLLRVGGYCETYLSTKYFAETLVRDLCEKHYIWRIRLPFDFDHSPRNYISKIKGFDTVWRQTNSLTHRGDFVRAALSMIDKRVPFGTYHMTNPGAVSISDIQTLIPSWRPHVINGPVSGCRLSTEKMASSGISMRPILEALEELPQAWESL